MKSFGSPALAPLVQELATLVAFCSLSSHTTRTGACSASIESSSTIGTQLATSLIQDIASKILATEVKFVIERTLLVARTQTTECFSCG